ncbi:conserved hypothetical tiny transmembrane protein [Terribacillus aidingensis]|uniref:Conserved hypothetical tiny transmembrane protein n=1 Tax=Terribacillus aidingensis TaxID=586416 RepID=A0A285NNB6_9BACI|nr:conserved hypothetical tiny transmembrane protein [Terribacillus aidingensis]
MFSHSAFICHISQGRNFTMGNYGGGFALIVVLFILLIIVGAAWL